MLRERKRNRTGERDRNKRAMDRQIGRKRDRLTKSARTTKLPGATAAVAMP